MSYQDLILDREEQFAVVTLNRPDKLLDEAKELARQIAFWPPVAMQMAKRDMQHGLESSLEDQLQYERHAIDFARRAPHDVEEAAASFPGSGAPLTSPGND